MPAQCPNLQRCPSEQGLWTPASLGSDYRVCFDAKDFAGQIITSGTSIDTWQDLLRNGLDVTSVTTKPIIVGNVFNGHPCIRFSSSPMDSVSNIVTGSTYSVICLVKDNSTPAVIQEPFSIGTANASTSLEFLLDYSGSIVINYISFYNAGGKAKTAVNYSDSPALLAMGLTGGVSKIRANGVNGTDVGSSISTATNVFRVGGSRPQNKFPLDGDLYCLLVIASPIGSLNYFKAEGWMAWNYSAPYLLGDQHPYRFSPPRDNRILTRKRRSLVLLAGASGVSGGGTTYNDSVSETASSADSAATALTAVSAFTESATAAELSEAAMTALSAFTESATAADVIDAALSLQTVLAESAASSDDLSSTATLAVVLSEILSALDSATTGSVFSDTISESAAADSVKSALMEMAAAISESASASDAHDTVLTAVNAILEASQSGDSLATIQTFASDLAESLAAIFAVTTGSIYFDTLDESASADATKSSLMDMVSALSESSTAADANATTLASVNAMLESLAAGDNQSSAQTMAATLAESLASLFAVTEGNVFSESLTESAGLAEALASAILSNVSFAESASPADSQSVAAVLAEVINEAILAGSSQAAQAVFADALTETLLALAVESSAVVGEIISPAAMLTNRVKSVLTASQKVHDLLGLSLGALGNAARPRIFTGQARTFLCGRNRGRLPFFEIHVSGQSFDHESYSAGAITQTALLTIHLGGKDPGAAGLLAERVLLASMAAIRNGSDNLLALGDETLGDLEQGPWGHRRTMTFTVTQTYNRTTYEVP